MYMDTVYKQENKKKQLDILSIYGAANMGLRNLH